MPDDTTKNNNKAASRGTMLDVIPPPSKPSATAPLFSAGQASLIKGRIKAGALETPADNQMKAAVDTTSIAVAAADEALVVDKPVAKLPPVTAMKQPSAADLTADELANGVPVSDAVALAGANPLDEPADPLDGEPKTDAMVDDIVVHEGDELLAAKDAASARRADSLAAEKPSLKQRIQGWLAIWWGNKWARYGTFAGLIVLFTLAFIIPITRYGILNALHVRSAASLTILDNTTQLPLENVTVELADRTAKTNQDGVVMLHGLKLGSQSLYIHQIGFAAINKTMTLGLGSNPLGQYTLTAVGTQFRFKLTDYLSGKPVTDADITSGDSNAKADKTGELVLTIGQDESTSKQATISAEGYRSETFNLDVGQKQSRSVVLVPGQKELFISKQSGKYDLYKMDIDGKNRQVLLAATGQEDSDISVAANFTGSQAALISRRDTLKDQDGYQLQSLSVIDVSDGSVLTLDHSERFRIVDWIGDDLIYVKIKAGTSAGNPERYQLISYNYDTTSRLTLASANSFNDIVSMAGSIYYAASNDYQGGVSQLARINPDSTGKVVLLNNTEVWDISRTAVDTLTATVLDGTYQYKIGDSAAKKTANTLSTNLGSRFYLEAADYKHSLWTDNRDGKGVLLLYTASTGKDTMLVTQSGLVPPIRWLNAHTVVYRVTTPSETADYAVSIDGGVAKKITDLTSTTGFQPWSAR